MLVPQLVIALRVVALLTCVVGGGQLVGCKPPDKQTANLAELRKDIPLSLSYRVEFVYTDSARIKARVKARTMKEITEGDPPRRITLAEEGLHMVFYNEKGEQQSSLTSQRGRFNTATEVHEALGNVIVITVEGDVLETERLIWEQRKNRIYTNEFVKITRPGEIILADSLESDTRFSSYKIYRIRGVIQVEE